jgi:hypothetical protein
VRPERLELHACCVLARLSRFSRRSCSVCICGNVFGIVHRQGRWGDRIGRIGLVRSWSSGRFDGLHRFEFSDAVEKNAFEFSQRLRVVLRLRALFDLQEGQAQRFQCPLSRSSFDGGNHNALQKVSRRLPTEYMVSPLGI